jgi:cell division protein FtsB
MLQNQPAKNQILFINKQIFITTCVCAALVLYFIFYAIFGDKGVVKYSQLKKELHNKELVKEGLENKMENKQNMVDGMSVESLDLDLLDEEARKNLGYAGKEEIVIYDEKNSK